MPALTHSPFFSAVMELLTQGSQPPDVITKARFMSVLGDFVEDAPLEGKVRGMFNMFRMARAGSQDVDTGKDVLYRDDVVAMMNALYATESQTMVEVMVTGLMQALGTGEGPACCIGWDRVYECCKEMEDLETILTLVWPKKAGEEQTAAG